MKIVPQSEFIAFELLKYSCCLIDSAIYNYKIIDVEKRSRQTKQEETSSREIERRKGKSPANMASRNKPTCRTASPGTSTQNKFAHLLWANSEVGASGGEKYEMQIIYEDI